MKGIVKCIFFMTAILLVALALPFGTSFVSAQEESDGILFGFTGGGITREPATETLVQVSITHTCQVDDELILEKVEIYGESDIPVETFDVNGTLESVADSYDQLRLLSEEFQSGPDEEVLWQAAPLAQEIRSKSFSTKYFTLDLNDLKQPLTVGDRVPIVAKATFLHHGEALVMERNLSVEYQPSLTSSPPELYSIDSLPQLQDWKPGVQHVHTEHSDWDWSYVFRNETHWGVDPPTVLDQAQAAANAGLSWIIITDHEEMLSAQEWLDERQECAQAELEMGIQVMCGEEVGSFTPTPLIVSIPIFPFFLWGRGHYLAYNIDSYITWP